MEGPSVTVNGMTFTFRRGFVYRVHCTLADWCGEACRRCGGSRSIRPMQAAGHSRVLECHTCHGTGRTGGHGKALVLAAPLEQVTLSEWRGESCRQCTGGVVPTDRDDNTCETCGGLYNSRAAVARARQEAGLPALTF